MRTKVRSDRPLSARVVHNLGRFAIRKTRKRRHQLRNRASALFARVPRRYRLIAAGLLIVFVGATVIELGLPWMKMKPYELSAQSRELLPKPSKTYAQSLEFNAKTGAFEYNTGYTGTVNPESAMDAQGSPRINASFSSDASKGLSVKDPISQIEMKLKPRFRALDGRQEDNQVFYKLVKNPGHLVYTAQAAGVKEDIVLERPTKDKLTYEYELGLESGLEARLESNGSIGVYGTDLPLNGDVSVGSEADGELLEKARQQARKTKLVFTIPAPVVLETNRKQSVVKAAFELEGSTIRLVAENLKAANYPLSIDPSVYVDSAQRLMRGNNETNLDFDVDNELIQKGKLTGARFDSWTNSLALPSARWAHGTAVAGGYAYVVGGSNGTTAQNSVYWAKFNTVTNAIESPNPGEGVCASWCTNAVYNLPAPRAGLSLTAYNGYLYAFGGVDAAGARTNSVYIAKIGLNGEPALWHPTDTNKANWVYWYQSPNAAPAFNSVLSSERSYAGAVAYNNRMYLIGGQTNASPGGVNTVEYADITPIGTLGIWTTGGMTALPSVRHNHSVQVYNDRLYVIGGNSNGALQASVQYIKINNDGSLVNAWSSSTPFPNARMAWGGNFAMILGGYVYVSGGCTAINGSGFCTTIADDTRLASINADGSVTDWGTIIGVTSQRMGYGLVGWRNTVYGIGGCTAHNTTNGSCTTTTAAASYGFINKDGDASTVSNSVPSGTNPCTTPTWYDCDIPPLGNGDGQGGRMSGGTVINNGFIYYIGGCSQVNSNSICHTGNSSRTSDTISYSAIAADGKLVRPATCTGTGRVYYGSWCVDNFNTINGTTGLAAFGYTIYNNVIYTVGGTDGTRWHDRVWRTTLNTDGSLNTWTSQLFSDLDLGANRGYQYVFTRANPNTANTQPANLYVLGGCSGVLADDNGLNCDGVTYTGVYKCNILTNGSLDITTGNKCTTAGQLQIDSEPNTAGAQGLGVMAGAVYANYIYLIGGQSPSQPQRNQVMYAKLDSNNNIVAVTGTEWFTSPNVLDPARRRGVAFGYNGYLYALAGYADGSSLNDLLFAKIDVSDGSISPFTTSFVTVNPRWDSRAIVNNGYVYTMGGCSVGQPPANCSQTTGSVQTFQLYNNYSGSPASYTSSSNLFATDRMGASTVILNGYIYVAGGCTSTGDCTAVTNSVQYAPLNPDGSVGTWAAAANLPAGRVYGQLEAAGGTLYYVGGQSATATDERPEVYYGTPSSGNISSWATASTGLPGARTKHGATVWNNRIYVTGGLDANAASQSNIYVSPSLAGGGNITSAWTTAGMTSFNVPRSGHTAIAYAGNLYILGGFNGTSYLSDVQYAKISPDGTVGGWSYSTSLPQSVSNADGYAANGFMYLFGGRSAATVCTNNTYVAPISANTTIASGNNPTGVGEWYQTNVKFTGVRYGAAVAHNDGRAYVIGGACGATLVYTGLNSVASSVMQSQPQIAKYSRMIDTDTDVFPTHWLMNGLDNDIGARWKMRYRSSTAATAAWGQETNFGTVTLGQPESYISLDSGGNDTNFARYYYLSVSIDSSQAFGYPEDVARGPTIADLTLFFTSDPSKRLRHGKTFTGGEQQPLDTPFRTNNAVVAGPNNGSSFTGSGWGSPSNAAANDGSFATISLGEGMTSSYLTGTGYGFLVPNTATITGIKIEVDAVLNQADLYANTVKGGSVVAGSKLGSTFNDEYLVFGGDTDLWGTSWTPADINASNFGAAISAYGYEFGSSAAVDHIRVTVYYTN